MNRKLLVTDLWDATVKKMMRLKANDGFSKRSLGEWLNFKYKDELINESASQVVDNSTRESMLEMWVKSFALNLTDIRAGCSISDLVPENAEAIDSLQKPPLGAAVIIGAGPSIWNHKHLDLLEEYIVAGKYQGIVCATDRMLVPCLERNIVPFIACGVDGAPIIKKFYEHPLVEKNADKIKAVLNTTTDHSVVGLLKKIGVHIYWFNPLFDDPHRSNESFTKMERIMTTTDKYPNGVCAMTCGGNAGAATWVIATNLLRRSKVALIGMDMGYPEGTKLETTPYFSALQYASDPTGAIAGFFHKIYNPYFKNYAYVDKIFNHYRESWRAMSLKCAPWVDTVNCTEGGTLFGERIKSMYFKDWLDKENLKSINGE